MARLGRRERGAQHGHNGLVLPAWMAAAFLPASPQLLFSLTTHSLRQTGQSQLSLDSPLAAGAQPWPGAQGLQTLSKLARAMNAPRCLLVENGVMVVVSALRYWIRIGHCAGDMLSSQSGLLGAQ